MLFFPKDPVSHTLILFLWVSNAQVSLMWQRLLSDQWKLRRVEIFLSTFRSAEQQKSWKLFVVCQYLPRFRSFLGVAIATGNPREDLQLWLGVPVLSAAVTIKSEFLLFVLYISTVAGIITSVRRLTDSKSNRKSMQLFRWDFVTFFFSCQWRWQSEKLPWCPA